MIKGEPFSCVPLDQSKRIGVGIGMFINWAGNANAVMDFYEDQY